MVRIDLEGSVDEGLARYNETVVSNRMDDPRQSIFRSAARRSDDFSDAIRPCSCKNASVHRAPAGVQRTRAPIKYGK